MDDFVSLAALLRGAQALPATAVQASREPAPVVSPPSAVRGVVDFAHADIVHELALMRLAVVESFERAKYTLLEVLAAEVLGRELALAPVDIEALASRALAYFSELEPVSIAVCASDAERVHCTVPMRIDAALAVGDLVVDVRDGSLETSFSFRLQSALDRAIASGAA